MILIKKRYVQPETCVLPFDARAECLIVDSPGGEGEAGLIDDGGDYYV